MTKQLQFNESPFFLNMGEDMLSAGRARSEALLKAQNDLMQQVEGLNRNLLDSIQQATAATSDFAKRAAECSNPGEVAALYSDWITQRTEAMFAESRRFAELWMKMFDAATTPLKATADAATEATQSVKAAILRPAPRAQAR